MFRDINEKFKTLKRPLVGKQNRLIGSREGSLEVHWGKASK